MSHYTAAHLGALPITDLACAQAAVTKARTHATSSGDELREPPPEPTSCCGRGCNGCVWEGFYEALHHWRVDALAWLGTLPPAVPAG